MGACSTEIRLYGTRDFSGDGLLLGALLCLFMSGCRIFPSLSSAGRGVPYSGLEPRNGFWGSHLFLCPPTTYGMVRNEVDSGPGINDNPN
jgi:hypothetical protein